VLVEGQENIRAISTALGGRAGLIFTIGIALLLHEMDDVVVKERDAVTVNACGLTICVDVANIAHRGAARLIVPFSTAICCVHHDTSSY
jgi:hypothetical protein